VFLHLYHFSIIGNIFIRLKIENDFLDNDITKKSYYLRDAVLRFWLLFWRLDLRREPIAVLEFNDATLLLLLDKRDNVLPNILLDFLEALAASLFKSLT
jgi:hypothetical protein